MKPVKQKTMVKLENTSVHVTCKTINNGQIREPCVHETCKTINNGQIREYLCSCNL